jgi:hypothetical protein
MDINLVVILVFVNQKLTLETILNLFSKSHQMRKLILIYRDNGTIFFVKNSKTGEWKYY